MLESIRFQNFKALKDTTLPLGRFTMIVGPNGSGKSTALQGLKAVRTLVTHGRTGDSGAYNKFLSIYRDRGLLNQALRIDLHFGGKWTGATYRAEWNQQPPHLFSISSPALLADVSRWLGRCRIYSLNEGIIATPVKLLPRMELDESGGNLAGALDRLRDEHPERFEALNDELSRLLPEFDRILFETPSEGIRGFALRTRKGAHRISAAALSQGTLLALSMLSMSYMPDPPSLIALEEPDRGIHPRLYREVQDALYRLAYPENYGENRDPVQVIITTHSPYMLDLHRDHPEEIVIAEKTEDGTKFHRLSDREDLDEILGDARLGEVWYSGVLGGVPAAP